MKEICHSCTEVFPVIKYFLILNFINKEKVQWKKV